MAEEKFILESLEDPKSKELAQVIASNTARNILGLLSKEDLSETDISNKLNIPLTTAHYNIQQLLRAKLIETKQFKWSDKGKKIHYYKISNKLVIIAPKSQAKFVENLKSLMPVALIGALTTGVIYLFTKTSPKIQMIAEKSIDSSAEMQGSALAQTLPLTSQSTNPALWFFLGLVTAIVLYLIISCWRSRK